MPDLCHLHVNFASNFLYANLNMKTEIKILIADDDPDILEFISYNLKYEGYQVFTAANGQEALKTAIAKHPDLIILDVMMPLMDGLETCQKIRKNDQLKDTLIVFLTARSDDYSHIAGLEAGADDYIVKPVKVSLLLSKVKSLLRRTKTMEQVPKTEIGELIIDREKYSVTFNGEDKILPRKEFELLSFLASKPGKVFTREEILTGVWGNDIIVGDRTIDVHIRKLREKLSPEHIKTIKGVGYKYEP